MPKTIEELQADATKGTSDVATANSRADTREGRGPKRPRRTSRPSKDRRRAKPRRRSRPRPTRRSRSATSKSRSPRSARPFKVMQGGRGRARHRDARKARRRRVPPRGRHADRKGQGAQAVAGLPEDNETRKALEAILTSAEKMVRCRVRPRRGQRRRGADRQGRAGYLRPEGQGHREARRDSRASGDVARPARNSRPSLPRPTRSRPPSLPRTRSSTRRKEQDDGGTEAGRPSHRSWASRRLTFAARSSSSASGRATGPSRSVRDGEVVAGVISEGKAAGYHTSFNLKGNPILKVVAAAPSDGASRSSPRPVARPRRVRPTRSAGRATTPRPTRWSRSSSTTRISSSAGLGELMLRGDGSNEDAGDRSPERASGVARSTTLRAKCASTSI
jgi:hypothetical protein